MNLERCVEEVELALDELVELNNSIPVIVEGIKDLRALRKLGLGGDIITLNKGISLSDFADKISEEFDEVIILSDWDRRGGSLCRRLKELLKGRVVYDVGIRQRLSKFAMIKKVEGLPSWLETVYHRMEDTTPNHDSSSNKNKSSMDI
ncbi:MAG: topoisomerase [Candidatus Thermoplasmatota archaeon]|nr:topoisomerase [Candidatus Thermoplasmatota archaeon]MBS3801979.1 topoisomerase [Candidatus Thermoplasmatota archaeon]